MSEPMEGDLAAEYARLRELAELACGGAADVEFGAQRCVGCVRLRPPLPPIDRVPLPPPRLLCR